MRDIFMAVLLIWCLYNTMSIWEYQKHEVKRNLIDKLTLQVIKCQKNRLDMLYDELGINVEENKGEENDT